jgi:hypothetical protein
MSVRPEKRPLPEPVTDDHHSFGVRSVFLRCEPPAQQRFHSEDREESSRDPLREHTLRFPIPRKIEGHRLNRREFLARRVLLAPI